MKYFESVCCSFRVLKQDSNHFISPVHIFNGDTIYNEIFCYIISSTEPKVHGGTYTVSTKRNTNFIKTFLGDRKLTAKLILFQWPCHSTKNLLTEFRQRLDVGL